MSSSQVVTQQATYPTRDQLRTSLFLGGILYDVTSGSIAEIQTLPVILPQQANQLVDLMDSLGSFSINGNRVTPNGANLSINKSSGDVFARAFNYLNGPVLTNNPHITVSPAQTPATFRRITQLASTGTLAPPVTLIDPANYDVGGVITPVGGGANQSTIQRVWLFATNVSSLQIAVQYGQNTYASLSAAVSAVGAGTFIPAPITLVGTLIGYLCVIRTATALNDPNQAVFIKAGKFATP